MRPEIYSGLTMSVLFPPFLRLIPPLLPFPPALSPPPHPLPKSISPGPLPLTMWGWPATKSSGEERKSALPPPIPILTPAFPPTPLTPTLSPLMTRQGTTPLKARRQARRRKVLPPPTLFLAAILTRLTDPASSRAGPMTRTLQVLPTPSKSSLTAPLEQELSHSAAPPMF